MISKKKDQNLISAVEPNLYRTRFVEFMKGEVIIDVTDERRRSRALIKRQNTNSSTASAKKV
jgi:hypothetical protein